MFSQLALDPAEPGQRPHLLGVCPDAFANGQRLGVTLDRAGQISQFMGGGGQLRQADGWLNTLPVLRYRA
jgi:hypothetical protein